MMAVAVQGTFKHAVSFEDAVTGQRFSKPLSRLPSSWFLELVFMLARRFSPSMKIGCREAPYVLSPLISTAQVHHTHTSLAMQTEYASRGLQRLLGDKCSPALHLLAIRFHLFTCRPRIELLPVALWFD